MKVCVHSSSSSRRAPAELIVLNQPVTFSVLHQQLCISSCRTFHRHVKLKAVKRNLNLEKVFLDFFHCGQSTSAELISTEQLRLLFLTLKHWMENCSLFFFVRTADGTVGLPATCSCFKHPLLLFSLWLITTVPQTEINQSYRYALCL